MEFDLRRSKSAVSFNMSRIKSKGSEIEKIMSSAFWLSGLRGYRKHSKTIFGKPDFSWKKYKIAVFCDSSFWHGRGWGEKAKDVFKVRKKFWISKIERNIERDKEVSRELKKQGWEVLRFWDNAIKKDTTNCVKKISKAIQERRQI
ncbi:MAG: very short patch repair endonuclease [PVC group bacterium]|nr:very short patch repair endonuclease [PVC group bacterium]